MDIDDKNIFFYPFTEPTLPSTIKETTPATRLATKSPQSENGMIPVVLFIYFCKIRCGVLSIDIRQILDPCLQLEC